MRSRFAQDAPDTIEHDRFAIREMEQDESHGPFPRGVCSRKVLVPERKQLHRFVSGRFQLLNELRR